MPEFEPGTEIDTSEDVDFSPESVKRLCRGGYGDHNWDERYERANQELRIQEVIAELHDGESRELFSCPFHGIDSHASFKVYPAKNNCYCFGCPPNTGFYDVVKFTRLKLECGGKRAIVWLERHFGLAPLVSINGDDEEERVKGEQKIVYLTFVDLADSFIELSAETFEENGDPWEARGYIEMFFDAAPSGDPESAEALTKLLPMAQELGRGAIEAIKNKKFGLERL